MLLETSKVNLLCKTSNLNLQNSDELFIIIVNFGTFG